MILSTSIVSLGEISERLILADALATQVLGEANETALLLSFVL